MSDTRDANVDMSMVEFVRTTPDERLIDMAREMGPDVKGEFLERVNRARAYLNLQPLAQDEPTPEPPREPEPARVEGPSQEWQEGLPIAPPPPADPLYATESKSATPTHAQELEAESSAALVSDYEPELINGPPAIDLIGPEGLAQLREEEQATTAFNAGVAAAVMLGGETPDNEPPVGPSPPPAAPPPAETSPSHKSTPPPNNGPYTCDEPGCGKEFPTYQSLGGHKYGHAADKRRSEGRPAKRGGKAPTPKGKPTAACRYCGKTFGRQGLSPHEAACAANPDPAPYHARRRSRAESDGAATPPVIADTVHIENGEITDEALITLLASLAQTTNIPFSMFRDVAQWVDATQQLLTGLQLATQPQRPQLNL